jgi:hypothetical protein
MINLKSRDISNVILLRVLGIILFLLSIIEFYLGAHIRGFIYSSFGAFYVGILSFISGISALSSYNGYSVATTCIFSILSVMVGVIGTVLDGIGVIVFGSIEGCVDYNLNYYYSDGYSDSKYQIENDLVCATSIVQNYASNNCYCISSLNSTVIITADGSQQELSGCWIFSIKDKNLNCNDFVNDLPNFLKASTSICGLIIFFCLITTIVSCCTLFCCKKPEHITIVGSTLNQPLRGTVINQI